MLLLTCSTCFSQEWKTNLKDAFTESKISGKDVLLFFSVSETCEACIELEETVFQTTEFKGYASENYILVKQDFQAAKGTNIEENLLIVEKYNKDGFFPWVVIISKDGKVLGNIGVYNGESSHQYVDKLRAVVTSAK